jgi:hypothetical protein
LKDRQRARTKPSSQRSFAGRLFLVFGGYL